ncbi:glutamate synthase [Thalassotalea euphylliae]|uniref:Glutamate synthase n=1 Tax=Thalassotalea euphylliae TaxID=1655234 RepID=A0A3E0TU69_9GAMM|nr:glutamate synthase-related protein [Thalassotalea euphylliae]REL27943.1 glutamate synthase [Thalassotalea euphylliae]
MDIWQPTPFAIDVKAGDTKAFCLCGLSKNGPFCDGSHKTTNISPKVVTFDEDKTVYACGCKQSKNRPYCDGSHKNLKQENSVQVVETPRGSTQSTEPIEPYVEFIQHLAKHGLNKYGHHGPMDAMGVPRKDLPSWDEIQFVTAQLAKSPLLDDVEVSSKVTIGPNANKPLELAIPLFVSDMSFGALSEEAKLALAKGAEIAGTGVCSGEGGMLPEEQGANSRYFYELASAQFGYSLDKVARCQAFHFKGGQAAKTGTGGHLPGNKVTQKIAEVRGLAQGQDAVSPATFPNFSLDDYQRIAQEVREATGGIPIGFKLSAQHIEADIDAALDIGVDYIILDGRGGGTGAAPLIFRDNISVPTIPALARARRHLTKLGRNDITLIITGGLRTPADFAKALALGADAIAVSNSAMQAIGCIGMRACNTNTCPVGVATQDPELRKRLKVDSAAQGLGNFFGASTELMKILARACGHQSLNDFSTSDLTTWSWQMHKLSRIHFGGDSPV